MSTHPCDSDNDEFHSMSVAGDDAGNTEMDDTAAVDLAPPVHPIPSLQGAFEESIADSTLDKDITQDSEGEDAQMRRRKLLHAERYEDVRRKSHRRSGARYHPFLKLCSQIVFGMHLLQQQQAKSNEEVVRILQNHVNEVDSILERTCEDLDLAYNDIKERIRYLKLPMEHMNIFGGMLDDKGFRTDLIAGNEKIEKIIRRTALALNDSMLDIRTGLKSASALGEYLNRIENEWPTHDQEIGDVFAAMRGNEQGWRQFLKELHKKGANLAAELDGLNQLIAEIATLAAAASRRNKHTLKTSATGSSPPGVRSKYAQESRHRPEPWLDKPLPKEPGATRNQIVAKAHPVPFSTRYEKPREQAPKPGSHNSSEGSRGTARQETRTPTETEQATQAVPIKDCNRTPEKLKGANPLRSHPLSPSDVSTNAAGHTSVKRSQSCDAGIALNNQTKTISPQYERSTSQGDAAILKQGRRSKLIPRKPIGLAGKKPKTPKRSQTIIRHVPLEQPPAGKELPSINTGFSRRISLKTKNLPPPLTHAPTRDPVAHPIDSAYSSGPDKDTQRSTSSTTNPTDKDGNIGSDPADPSEVVTVKAERPATKDSSRLGLFPKDTGPLTPIQASFGSKEGQLSNPGPWPTDSNDVPSRPTHQPKASRTLSIRKFLHI